MLALRGQDIDAAQFVAFARRLGPPQPHVIDQFHHPDDPNILILSNVRKDGQPTGLQDAGSYFHTDYSYLQVPARATTLYSRVVPKRGGDTLFADQQAAYDDLPQAMKERIEPLLAIHHYGNRNDVDETSRTVASVLTDEQKAKMPLITHRIARPASGDGQEGALRRLRQLVRHRRHARRRSARPARRAGGALDGGALPDAIPLRRRRHRRLGQRCAAAFGHAHRSRRRAHAVADHRPRACAGSGGAGGARADVRRAALIRVTAFRWVPPFAQGLVRDLRVRWALEEAELPYEEHLIAPEDQKTPAYRALQPFGQVPVLEEDETTMFESGAIVLHIAERSAAPMPDDGHARERVRTWILAALNSVEPPIMMLNMIDLQPGGATEGTKPLRELVQGAIGTRLDSLAAFLGNREHLVADRFTAADLLMTTVLRILRNTDLVAQRPTLGAYKPRRGATGVPEGARGAARNLRQARAAGALTAQSHLRRRPFALAAAATVGVAAFAEIAACRVSA